MENTVTLSLERYHALIEKEKQLKTAFSHSIITMERSYSGFYAVGHNTPGLTVEWKTNDEAVKEMAEREKIIVDQMDRLNTERNKFADDLFRLKKTVKKAIFYTRNTWKGQCVRDDCWDKVKEIILDLDEKEK